jgi:hypothetical protein
MAPMKVPKSSAGMVSLPESVSVKYIMKSVIDRSESPGPPRNDYDDSSMN